MIKVQPCGVPTCPEHRGRCAYHGDEPDRCPWCHATWTSILGRRHSCETIQAWETEHRTWRIARARQMRQEAARRPQAVEWSTHCPHRDQDMGRVRFVPLTTAEQAA